MINISRLDARWRFVDRFGWLSNEAVAAFAFGGSILLNLVSVVRSLLSGPLDFRAKYVGSYIAAAHGNPYDQALDQAVGHHLLGVPLEATLPYVDPPAFTLVMYPFAQLPFRAAAAIWLILMVLSAVVCGLVVAHLLGVGSRQRIYVLLLAAVTLDFAPVRHGLGLGQSDLLVGLLSLTGLWLALHGRRLRGGFVAGLAIMKPQTALLALLALMLRGGWRTVAGAVAGALALYCIPEVLSSAGLGLSSHNAWIVGASQVVNPPNRLWFWPQVAIGIGGLAFVGYLATRARRGGQPSVFAYGTAVSLNAAVGPLVHLNPQSEVLLLLPLGVLVRSWLIGLKEPTPWLTAAVRGLLMGGLFGDASFAVAHYAGVVHAAYPWFLTLLLAMGVVCLVPSFYREVLCGLGWNLAITAIPFDPPFYFLFASGIALLLLIMLARGAERRETVEGPIGAGYASHSPS